MLGALGGVVLGSFLFARDARYVAAMTVLYSAIAVAYSFSLPV